MLSTPYERFLAELRETRKKKGLSQGTLASRIRLSRAQYTAIENGRSTVNFIHLYNLATALGVSFHIGGGRFICQRE